MTPLVRELTPPPDPATCVERLAGLSHRVFLDSAAAGPRLGRYSFVTADPVMVIRSRGGRTWVETGDGRRGTGDRRQETGDRGDVRDVTADGDALAAIRRVLAPAMTPPVPGLPPFQGGVIGYIGYDWGLTLERLPAPRFDDLGLDDVVFGVYDWVLAWDHAASKTWLVSTGMAAADDLDRQRRAAERADAVTALLASPDGPVQPAGLPKTPGTGAVGSGRPSVHPVVDGWWDERLPLGSSFSHDGYLDVVSKVREYIYAGDIFQANISQRFEAPLDESPWSLYRRLRRHNPAPFASFLDLPGLAVVSASPERFLQVDPSGHVETRPIKGTRARGLGPEHDAALGQALTESAKDRAENLMIVDLMRNDLSRVCLPGSVRVSELFTLERYATVHHLVSTVVGDLAPGTDALDLLRAAFPGGSITGAPKLRAMEIIAECEPSRRGVYCGSIGYWSVTGALDTSIAIRTAVVRDGRVYFSAGGGIVADSVPEQEYRETLDKARATIDVLGNGAMILVLDNRDSFVYNLARYVRELGDEAVVWRSDEVTLDAVETLAPSHIIISPGPCTPREAGISTDVVRRLGSTTPILGVCLGHQCIGEAYGGDVVRAPRPKHGKTSRIVHDGTSVFAGLPSPMRVARYHSLVIAPNTVPDCLRVVAESEDDGVIMAVAHRAHPVVGVQFHPESAATEFGYAIVDRFLHGDRSRGLDLPPRADGARDPLGTPSWGTPEDERAAFVPPSVDWVR